MATRTSETNQAIELLKYLHPLTAVVEKTFSCVMTLERSQRTGGQHHDQRSQNSLLNQAQPNQAKLERQVKDL